MKFKIYKQLNAMDCGPTCIRMVARYYGRYYKAENIRTVAGLNKEGVSLLGLSDAAEKIGFRTRGMKLTYEQLTRHARLPCILHWNQNHFVVLLPMAKWRGKRSLKVADPGKGLLLFTKKELESHWIDSNGPDGEQLGTALLLEPSANFYDQVGDKREKLNWGLIFQYFKNSRWNIAQIFIALLITSLLQLAFPILTQSIVDTGINTRNLSYVTIVLVAQLMLIFSKAIVDFIRNRLLLKLSVIVNLSILSDFWIKITSLPLAYFQDHHTGDTLQRITDNKQIQSFMTGSALNTIFSLINLVLFGLVLANYNPSIFFIFAAGGLLYFIWVKGFMRFRRRINYESFYLSGRENNATLQLIQGMQDIRLNGAERLKRWEWENLQTRIFGLTLKNLNYSQLQQAGALIINQGKDALITFLVAKMVIEGGLTFGAMLAIQYILGQLSGPIEQFILFMQNAQDARISMERLNEVHQLENEEKAGTVYITRLPKNKDIHLTNFSFTYPGAGNAPVLSNINLQIPEGKVTAIVGGSGSGKTTLLKILLKIHERYQGEVRLGNSNLKYMGPTFWRTQCGAVLQDGYIFNNHIIGNIAVADETPDYERLIESCRIANILSFIESLPNGFNTMLGAEGFGISQGQKQRLLIARALYKDPQYIFFDEATNALDANNERTIVENLQEFFKGRTVVVVAHRLSTVKNADKIVVLDQGRIMEEGTHQELATLRGHYFQLVKNQLELGN